MFRLSSLIISGLASVAVLATLSDLAPAGSLRTLYRSAQQDEVIAPDQQSSGHYLQNDKVQEVVSAGSLRSQSRNDNPHMKHLVDAGARRSLQSNENCRDMETTTFLDETDTKRNCTWLAKQLSIPSAFDRLNRIYCGKLGGFLLTDYRTPLAAVVCPVTCNRECSWTDTDEVKCTDTSALVGSPNLEKKKKKCNWIKKSQKRLDRYCSKTEGVSSRGDAVCPRTCNKCGSFAVKITAAPTAEPSSKPSLELSEEPTAMISDAPSTLPTVDKSMVPSMMTSAVPSAKPSTRFSQSPSVSASAAPSLLFSDAPSIASSSSPSGKASSLPSAEPSSSPSTTVMPTPELTNMFDVRAAIRLEQCGTGTDRVPLYDFLNPKQLVPACDVCLGSIECQGADEDDADNGDVRCCRWTFGQICMEPGRYWSETLIERRCI